MTIKTDCNVFIEPTYPQQVLARASGCVKVWGMQICIASGNKEKAEAISSILEGLNGFQSAGIFSEAANVEEDQDTYLLNAEKKAFHLLSRYRDQKGLVIADDSGMEVTGMNGEPGLLSKRYAGEEGNFARNVDKVLSKLAQDPSLSREAEYVTSICIVSMKSGAKWSFEERLEGTIQMTPRGKGPSYYSIFQPKGLTLTLAECPVEERLRLSPRSKLLVRFHSEWCSGLKREFLG